MEMSFVGRVARSEDASEREEEREELSRGIWKEVRTRGLCSATATAAHYWGGPHVEDVDWSLLLSTCLDPTTPPDSLSVERLITSGLHSEHLLRSPLVVFALAYNSKAIVLVIPARLPRLPVSCRGVDLSNCAPFPPSMIYFQLKGELKTRGLVGNWRI
jgi:hypothetical protein